MAADAVGRRQADAPYRRATGNGKGRPSGRLHPSLPGGATMEEPASKPPALIAPCDSQRAPDFPPSAWHRYAIHSRSHFVERAIAYPTHYRWPMSLKGAPGLGSVSP